MHFQMNFSLFVQKTRVWWQFPVDFHEIHYASPRLFPSKEDYAWFDHFSEKVQSAYQLVKSTDFIHFSLGFANQRLFFEPQSGGDWIEWMPLLSIECLDSQLYLLL